MESDFGLSCSCGSENFERVSVRRMGMSDYATDFVACVHCHVMFFLPHRPAPADPTSSGTQRSPPSSTASQDGMAVGVADWS